MLCHCQALLLSGLLWMLPMASYPLIRIMCSLLCFHFAFMRHKPVCKFKHAKLFVCMHAVWTHAWATTLWYVCMSARWVMRIAWYRPNQWSQTPDSASTCTNLDCAYQEVLDLVTCTCCFFKIILHQQNRFYIQYCVTLIYFRKCSWGGLNLSTAELRLKLSFPQQRFGKWFRRVTMM